MRTLVIVVVASLVVIGLGAASWQPLTYYWQLRSMPKWRKAEVVEGPVVSVVNATGSIKPVLQVSVGSFVSGPIDADYQLRDKDGSLLYDKEGLPLSIAEFNQEVREGDEMAKIDPRIYEAALARDEASKLSRESDLIRARALRLQAENNKRRAAGLIEEAKKQGLPQYTYISEAEWDRVRYEYEALEAQVEVARAAVTQAEAQRDNSKLNVEYCLIKAPVTGIVINRKIDPGQTLAAQFQTPELFVVAPDMRKKMHVHASVDEADIGMIQTAQQKKLPVTFTVDAYNELFAGVVEEVRLSSTTTQNVVTYPVVVAAANPDLKLLPGMTANLSFEVDRRDKAIKIPNSALRFFPLPIHVRDQDKPLLEGQAKEEQADPAEVQETGLSAEERAEARRLRKIRHVWVVDGTKLRAVEVIVGLSESRFTEMVSGDLKVGDQLVTGIEPPKAWGQ
jgi:HlyD family secretion protein